MKITEKDFIWHEGKRYARVTATLKGETNFGGASAARIHNKGVIGTLVHEAIDQDLRDELPHNLPPPCMGYFRSYSAWRKRVKLQVLEREKRYYDNSLMISGQIDVLARFPFDEAPVLVDWKTSAAESPAWIKQAHLYAHLIGANGGPVSNRYIFVKLDALGASPDIFEYFYSEQTYSYSLGCVKKFWGFAEKWLTLNDIK